MAGIELSLTAAVTDRTEAALARTVMIYGQTEVDARPDECAQGGGTAHGLEADRSCLLDSDTDHPRVTIRRRVSPRTRLRCIAAATASWHQPRQLKSSAIET